MISPKDPQFQSSSTPSITLAFRPLASISPSSTPFLNSSGIAFHSSGTPPSFNPWAPCLISSPALPNSCPAWRLISDSFEGPMTRRPARATMASSPGPRPKRESRAVFRRWWVMGDVFVIGWGAGKWCVRDGWDMWDWGGRKADDGQREDSRSSIIDAFIVLMCCGCLVSGAWSW